MTIFLTILATIAVLAAVFAALYQIGKRAYLHQQAAHAEHLRRWAIQRAQFDAEQRLRNATHAAMRQMLHEARTVASANPDDGFNSNTSGRDPFRRDPRA